MYPCMKIPRIFPPEEEVAKARDTVKKLKASSELDDDEKSRLEVAHTLLRQNRRTRGLIAGIGATLIVGATAAGIALSSHEKQDQKPTVADVPEDKHRDASSPDNAEKKIEEDTDQLIVKAEQGAKNLENALTPKVEKFIEKESLKSQLLLPFELVRINASNPGKNGPRFHRQGTEKGEDIVAQRDPNWFGYKAAHLDNAAAAFEAPFRLMDISPDFDPENLLDVLVFYHELRHAMQDTQTREQIHSEKEFQQYIDFFLKPPVKYPVLEEASAYLYEIEALNLLLDNQLKESIEKGKILDIQFVAKKLGIKPNDQKRIDLLRLVLTLAEDFYRSGSGLQIGITRKFMDALITRVKEHGGSDLVFIDHVDFRNPQFFKP